MKRLIHLYPKSWRQRYGDELIDYLEQTDSTFYVLKDLLKGIVDAWKLEISEREIYGIRMSYILLLVSLINVFVVLKFISLWEVILMEQVAIIIAMVSFFLAVSIFFVNLFRSTDFRSAFSIKTKLSKMSVGLMGLYAISYTVFLVLAN